MFLWLSPERCQRNVNFVARSGMKAKYQWLLRLYCHSGWHFYYMNDVNSIMNFSIVIKIIIASKRLLSKLVFINYYAPRLNAFSQSFVRIPTHLESIVSVYLTDTMALLHYAVFKLWRSCPMWSSDVYFTKFEVEIFSTASYIVFS